VSAPAYAAFFGFSAQPFSKEIDDKDLWLPPSKTALVDEMIEALAMRQSISLVGDPGVGKTCVLRSLRHRVTQLGFRLTYCHNATLGRRDFYRQLCLALGLSPSATAAAVFWAVSSHVQELSGSKLHPVFLLDESHLLHQDTLDHLHILLNYEWDQKALLSLVLVGLPELGERLCLRRNRSLQSRIHTRLTIGATTQQDTAEYCRYRLINAGFDRELFASDAIAMLHEASSGSLRGIDRIATLALRETARRKNKIVERDCIAHVIDQDAEAQ